MTAAARGWKRAKVTRPATPRSSARLTSMLLTGSGEVLTAIRVPAFTRWLASAVPPPIRPAVMSDSEPLCPASSAPTQAPATGRITVCAVSHTESTYGILSATASQTNSTPAAISTSGRCRAEGTSSLSPVAPNTPSSSTTAYALMPLAQPLVNTMGSTDTDAIVTSARPGVVGPSAQD